MKPPQSQHTTAAAIVKWYESKPQEHRPHMGASLIGHECERHVWLSWRWALKAKFPGRVLRLFDTGVREETRIIEELKGIGATVWDRDPQTGDQWRVSAVRGHFGGSLDGVAEGLPESPKTPAVLEFKTHNHKSFTQLIEKKVREAKPQHYKQMQTYMGLMELERALYIAVDKDTDDVYTEWVHFDQAEFDGLLEKAERLIGMTEPPPRLSEEPTHWQCKFCTHHPVCFGTVAAEANCRTCCHATPVDEGAWKCEFDNQEITTELQRHGCQHHLMIPALVAYAEPVDGGSTWVAYKHKASEKTFVNGPADLGDTNYGPVYSSVELQNCPESLLADTMTVKEHFPDAKVVSGTAFDDMESDDLDAVPTKGDAPGAKEKKARITKTLKALQAFKP